MKSLFESIAVLPLKEMDGSLLSVAIMQEAAALGVKRLDEISEAISVASYLHRDDTRANRKTLPRDTYITHPLRNTLRLIRYYGVTDPDILIASILHDTVEDHPSEIVEDLAGLFAEGKDDETIRALALSFISGRYGSEVARIVSAVSNPFVDKNLTKDAKRALYAEHVEAAITNDPPVFLVKFADFYDNAGSLHHTADSLAATEHRVLKYSPLIDIFEKHGNDLSPLLGDYGYGRFVRHLLTVKHRLEKMRSEVK